MESGPTVIVIGAGVAGLTLRRALLRQGIDCQVFEQSDGLATRGAGLTIWPNATSVLSRIGCLDQLRDRSFPLVGGHLLAPSGRTLAKIDLKSLVKKTGWPVAGVARAELLQVLSSSDQSSIHFGKRLVGIEHRPNGVLARFEDGAEVFGAVVVGADGISSMTRHLMGDRQKRYSGYVGLQGLAEVETDLSAKGIATWILGPGSQFGVIPVSPGTVYFFGTMNVAENDLDRESSYLTRLEERFDGWGGPVRSVLDALDDSDIIHTPIYDRPATKTWTTGGVTALGDAAHGLTPTFGQGACLAIESAESLATQLGAVSRGASVQRSLAGYEEQRISRTRPVVGASRLFGRALQIENPTAAAVRNELLRWIPNRLHLLSLAGVVNPGLRHGRRADTHEPTPPAPTPDGTG